MKISDDGYLAHYGVLRKSGRYPWGSGGTQDQRNRDFLSYFADLKRQGMSDVDICRGVGITTTEYRAAKSIAVNQQKQAKIAEAVRLKEKGMSNVAIAQQMFGSASKESSVRALLESSAQDRADVLQTTANMLRDSVSEKQMIDVGVGVERHIGVNRTKMDAAIAVLKEEGYVVHRVKSPQVGTGKMTEYKVLCKPGTEWKYVKNNMDKIQQFSDYSTDGGRTYSKIQEPISISSHRVGIAYKEDGGDKADGVIYVRRGVEDISLGKSRYAQVRVAVDGTHYLKGMAIYKDDLPPGVDLVFNTNKSDTGNKLDAMKKMTGDTPDSPTYNPFGSIVRQLKLDPNNPDRITSAMNLVNEEGEWEKWSKSVSSQVLSKQNRSLAKQQLDLTYQSKKQELDEIMALTNPGVRKKLLDSYAEDADSSAVHLKAAGMPRQGSHVILPIQSLKETEVYAPNYMNGERVVLIRYPHGGTFEIPELTVNNKHPESKRVLGDARDAIGINAKVAERLSGADFDGDTVLVIPNTMGKIKTQPALEGLKNFDPKSRYPAYEGMPVMTPRQKGMEMGLVSNLITDMTIQGASAHELAAAVRHSMVVIDAEKHELNYKQSALDNNIPSLMKKYQGRSQGGSATLISRSGSSSHTKVLERKQGFRVDPATGKKIFTETGASYVNAKGKTVFKTQNSPKLAEVDDAFSLSSGTPVEKVYAEHSNKLKALANQARKESVNTRTIPYSSSAKAVYHKEVASLEASLHLALRNAPLERQAQLLANANISAKRAANPDMDSAELKKLKSLALVEARRRTGAGKELVVISDREWEAIQAGAVSNNTLSKILNNTDLEMIKERSTPRTAKLMTSSKKSRAKSMANLGYTQAEIASALGVSLTTLKKEFPHE